MGPAPQHLPPPLILIRFLRDCWNLEAARFLNVRIFPILVKIQSFPIMKRVSDLSLTHQQTRLRYGNKRIISSISPLFSTLTTQVVTARWHWTHVLQTQWPESLSNCSGAHLEQTIIVYISFSEWYRSKYSHWFKASCSIKIWRPDPLLVEACTFCTILSQCAAF